MKSLLCLTAVFWCAFGLTAAQVGETRQSITLDGDWQFQQDHAAAWKTVQVPSSFQSHEGTEFHGVGWYRKHIEPFTVPARRRVLLHFQAAATQAQIWWDGQLLGNHLGGWTPFRFDLTELLRSGPAGRPHELRVRLDEKVGHNTQGFLPVIAPHFGGLWQGVELLIVPETYIDDLALTAVGDPLAGSFRLEVPLDGDAQTTLTNLALRVRRHGHTAWRELTASVQRSPQALLVQAPLQDFQLWSPAAPNLYELEIALPGPDGDRVRTRAAFRSIRTYGPEFLLNDRPLNIRGLLNWGYSPPLLAPNPGETAWRSELEFARSHGFNLMKFCLWVPPQRYLELADEMGMLTWMEYPTWHPKLTTEFLEALRREFNEFFRYDRNHPSVILRSLTCETGPLAELSVMRSLYEAAHQAIPGALVEDDSSWIAWNRVHDFYDDHPYGNNQTWVKTLTGFNSFILAHGLKPLVLGETTSADTWLARESLLKELGAQRPWWAPRVLEDTGHWLAQVRAQCGENGLAQLESDSLHYGLLMRKYQIEAYRREVPYGGYVISVIRDIPSASMGLLDYLGQPKWTAEQWQWQRDTICLLNTEADRRSFVSGTRFQAEVLLSHFGLEEMTNATLELTLRTMEAPGGLLGSFERTHIDQGPGTLAQVAQLDWPLPEVSAPTHLLLKASLRAAGNQFDNQWPLWVLPNTVPQHPTTHSSAPQHRQAPTPAGQSKPPSASANPSTQTNPGSTSAASGSRPDFWRNIQVHDSLSSNLRRELFPGCPPFDPSRLSAGASGRLMVVASHFDDALATYLEQGGRVLLLPDGQPQSLPLQAHWFLRGAPFIPDSALSGAVPRELWLELQHFDLASDVVPDLPYLDEIDPILLLWDTHDNARVKTHGLVFETRAGRGRLLVSALHHAGATNAAGHWLLSVFLNYLDSGPAPRHALAPVRWAHLKASLHGELATSPQTVFLAEKIKSSDR